MTTSVLFTLTALTQSDYLAILPRSLCEAIPDLLWRDLGQGNWLSPIYIMRRKRAHISLGVQQLLQELRKND
jgi:DNA-binding transcriptional LysR family regulator